MKHLLSAAVIAALLAGAVSVRADDSGNSQTGGPPFGGPNAAGMAAMQQAHAKLEQLHAQARVSMLNALSPAHRNLLAQVVGQLVISPSPDLAAGAKALDTNLTPVEAKSVLNVQTSFDQQARQIMESVRQQMRGGMQGSQGPHGQYAMRGMAPPEETPTDAGLVLLGMAGRTLDPHAGHPMGFMGGPPPGN